MHSEWGEITPTAAAELNQHSRGEGGRVVAVGTTVVRTLETGGAERGGRRPTPKAHVKSSRGRGRRICFIRPPFEFRAIDALVDEFSFSAHDTADPGANVWRGGTDC